MRRLEWGMMTFSGPQWLAVVALDLLIKAVYLLVSTLNILAPLIAVYLTILHLLMFLIARACLNLATLPRRFNIIATLLATNILFAGASVYLWISYAQSRRISDCFGVEMQCQWIDGVITPLGRQTLLSTTCIYVLLNITTFLIVTFFSNRQRTNAKL